MFSHKILFFLKPFSKQRPFLSSRETTVVTPNLSLEMIGRIALRKWKCRSGMGTKRNKNGRIRSGNSFPLFIHTIYWVTLTNQSDLSPAYKPDTVKKKEIERRIDWFAIFVRFQVYFTIIMLRVKSGWFSYCYTTRHSLSFLTWTIRLSGSSHAETTLPGRSDVTVSLDFSVI